MIERPAKKQRKGSITEQDVASLLQRYTPKTVLTILHEVSQCTDSKKIDWNGLVKKTSTGISSAREYQMIWRHLAYRDSLLDIADDSAQTLDDDSDLEFELEAFPSVSNEASSEAAACVKVLISSAISGESNRNGSTVEAPLTINIPNLESSRGLEQPSCSSQGTNIIFPVFIQKQPTPATTVADGLDKRKRKQWTKAEDTELFNAVQKCGEGNWASIARGHFKGDRTASQLSQRWSIIKKRRGNNINVVSSSSGPQLSEAQLAARYAMSVALDMPVTTSNTIGQAGIIGGNKSAGTSIKSNTIRSNGTNNSLPASATATLAPSPSGTETSTSTPGNNLSQSQMLSQENLTSKSSPIVGSLGPKEKPRAPVKKTMLKPTSNPNSSDAMVRATAVAAGARIASPSDAASLLKAAQAKNAIHIMPSGGGSIKSSMSGSMSSISEALPNVHYIRTGLVHTPLSNYTAASPTIPSTGPARAPPPLVKMAPAANGASSSDVSVKLNSNVTSTQSREIPIKKEVKTLGEASGPELSSATTKEQIQGNKVTSTVPAAVPKVIPGTMNPVGSSNLKTAEPNGTSRTNVSVGSTSLKTPDLKGVSDTNNPVASSNLKATELKGKSGCQNPVGSSNLKAAELKGTNGGQTQNPVSSSTSQSQTSDLKGANGAPKAVSSSISTNTTEVKVSNGAQKAVDTPTSRTGELKSSNGTTQNPVSSSTLKTDEVKATNGTTQNPISSSTSKRAEKDQQAVENNTNKSKP